MTTSDNHGNRIGFGSKERGIGEQAGLTKCLLPCQEPHLDALFESRLTVVFQLPIDFETSYLASIPHCVRLGIECSKGLNPINARLAVRNPGPQSVCSDAKRGDNPHSRDHDFTTTRLHDGMPPCPSNSHRY